ncbi:MAG: sodium/proline symporter [Verrucomicrobiota bacterium]
MTRPNPLFLFLAAALVLGSFGCRTSGLVNIQSVIPGIVLDIRYATTNNFTGQELYPVAKCVLRTKTAEKLGEVQADLASQSLALKVFDGYRPLSVQKKMWAIFPNPDYVADPKKGSRHNRGAAVDLTLIHLPDQRELPMPTAYDDFTPKAHRDYMNLAPDAIHNRELLENVMAKHGFVGLPTEWWHFDDTDWKRYGILDVDYSKVR